MEVGTKIDIQELKKGRAINAKELITFFQMHKQRFWCWGATAWTVITDNGEHMALRFYVTGLLFKGNVYVRCNAMDEMDVYLTTKQGTIIHTIDSVGIENLFDCIDSLVEIKG